jgi:excisionase family DNA binding protein
MRDCLPPFKVLLMGDRWLSIKEIAQHLGVSKDAIYAWITTKSMPAHRVGRLWRFKKEAADIVGPVGRR